ncbi:DUF3618 domain-containing protein [Streptomyces sp. NPDC006529]|uniref:DUF3618 domain-containing protein n=1 Tax=Streptomyces sp. NPDC006529 TaxID=3157177 RepID=UPI0033BFA25B
MTEQSQSDEATAAELRHQIEHTREELGRTVEALAHKADVKAQAKEKTAQVKEKTAEAKGKAVAVKDQAVEKAAVVAGQLRESAEHAARRVKEKTPDPVLDTAGQAVAAARTNRTPLLALGGAVLVFLLVRRARGRK